MRSISSTGRKLGVTQILGGSGEYLRYWEEVASISDTGRKRGVPQLQGESGSISGTGSK